MVVNSARACKSFPIFHHRTIAGPRLLPGWVAMSSASLAEKSPRYGNYVYTRFFLRGGGFGNPMTYTTRYTDLVHLAVQRNIFISARLVCSFSEATLRIFPPVCVCHLNVPDGSQRNAPGSFPFRPRRADQVAADEDRPMPFTPIASF